MPTMPNKLDGIRVAMLVTDGFEEIELTEPRKALESAGAICDLVSPAQTVVTSWDHVNWGTEFVVDVELDDAHPVDYQCLLLPGGVINPDRLRMNPKAVAFVRTFVESGKPIAAICHGPWTLINAGGVKNRTLTSWPSLKVDLTNAGANWVDEECVRDGDLITSRKPADLPAFNRAIVEVFAEARQHA